MRSCRPRSVKGPPPRSFSSSRGARPSRSTSSKPNHRQRSCSPIDFYIGRANPRPEILRTRTNLPNPVIPERRRRIRDREAQQNKCETLILKFKKTTKHKKIGMVLSVWAVMFFSKFVFLGAIDIVFSSNVDISGFIGLIIIILCATILQKLISIINQKL